MGCESKLSPYSNATDATLQARTLLLTKGEPTVVHDGKHLEAFVSTPGWCWEGQGLGTARVSTIRRFSTFSEKWLHHSLDLSDKHLGKHTAPRLHCHLWGPSSPFLILRQISFPGHCPVVICNYEFAFLQTDAAWC